MKRVTITFGTIPTPQGPISLTAQYEKVTVLTVTPGSDVYIKTENGDEFWWNWGAVQNVSADPHGSITKAAGPLITP